MREEFDKLVAAGKLSRQHVEPLVKLTTSGYCLHRGWGFGRITTVDTVFVRLTVDFPGKPGHAMDLAFAAQSLQPIPKDHILARKAADLEGLRQMAALHHLELIKLVLNSYGGKATLEQIQQMLVPEVIGEDWRKWWEAARQELKKDGHILLPSKKTDPLVYQEQPMSVQERLLATFRSAKGLKARHTAAQELLKSLDDLEQREAVAAELIAALNAEILTHQRTQPAVAIEAIFVRDDLRAAAALPPLPDELTPQAIWAQELKLGPLLEQIPASRHRRVLQSFRDAFPIQWADLLLATLNVVPARLVGELIQLLIQEKKLDALKDTLARLINQHQAGTELLLWLARERSDSFADILGPEVFRAMLTAMERDQFNERKSRRLRDYIVDDQELLVELIGTADLEVIKDLTRALQLSLCFDDMDKRSLLARIVKSYPAMQALISGEQTRQDTWLAVSWESLERRKEEYAELVRKTIPANSREIAIARGYGDLRENHEYKAAKEMQKLLMRRKAELELQLVRARGTNFQNPPTHVVSVGTCVHLLEIATQHPEALTILGAWDSDPERNIISYLSPLAQALLNKKPGEEVEFELDGHRKHYRIEAVQPALALSPLEPAHTAAPAESLPAPLPPAADPAQAAPPTENADQVPTSAENAPPAVISAENATQAAAPAENTAQAPALTESPDPAALLAEHPQNTIPSAENAGPIVVSDQNTVPAPAPTEAADQIAVPAEDIQQTASPVS